MKIVRRKWSYKKKTDAEILYFNTPLLEFWCRTRQRKMVSRRSPREIDGEVEAERGTSSNEVRVK